jgi:hypothetical protein
MTPEDRDFRNCAWSGKAKNLSEAYFCNRKRLQLREADVGIGICPCRDWIHVSQRAAKHGQTSKKGRETPPTLIGEPEKEEKIV